MRDSMKNPEITCFSHCGYLVLVAILGSVWSEVKCSETEENTSTEKNAVKAHKTLWKRKKAKTN